MWGYVKLTSKIIEIATIVTNKNLEIVKEGPSIVISQEKELMEKMDNWNTLQHKKSGLYEQVLLSSINCRQAEIMTLEFIKSFVKEKLRIKARPTHAPKNGRPLERRPSCPLNAGQLSTNEPAVP